MSASKANNNKQSEPVIGALAGKVSDPTDVARSEKALLNVSEGTLYFPVLQNDIEIGGIFIGAGQVLIDAIIDTSRGAIGKSYEFVWNGSLLLLTNDAKWSPPAVEPVKHKDLKVFLLDSSEEAQARAKEIFYRFYNENRDFVSDTFISRNRGWIATILDKQRGKSGIVASDDRLVMKLGDLKVVISGNKLIQKEGRKKIVIAGRAGHVLRIG